MSRQEDICKQALKFEQRLIEGYGDYFHVVQITPNLVAKVSNYGGAEYLQKEFKNLSLFRENGIIVPKPEGVFKIPYKLLSWSKQRSGLVMEYIDGVSPDDLPWLDQYHADRLFEVELEKVRKLGYMPMDEQ